MRKRAGVYFLILLFGILLTFDAGVATSAAKDALVLCYEVVIPSLFPFFVLSSFAVESGFLCAVGKLVSPVANALFSVSGSGVTAFVIGLLCGSPTGAKTVAELYQKRMIEKKEAERLLGFCNNVGPVFILGAVGKMLGDSGLSKTLFMVHIIASVLTGVFLSIGSRKRRKTEKTDVLSVNFGSAFTDAVTKSIKTMLNVCGFVVLFSVIIAFLKLFFLKISMPSLVSDVIGGFFEMTVGVKDICASGVDLLTKLVLLSGVLGFGGLCVFLQGCSAVSGTDLSVKTYFFGKLLQSGLSVLLTKLFFAFRAQGSFLLQDIRVFGVVSGICLLFFMVLPIVDKRFKNTYNRENSR